MYVILERLTDRSFLTNVTDFCVVSTLLGNIPLQFD